MPGRRSFTRRSGDRDSKLIIIAAEGTETEKIYFDGLKTYYANPRIHIEVLERIDTGSDPIRVLRLLDEFRKEYSLRIGFDQLWLVIDVDRWGNQKLANVSRQCLQKQYQLAISNPAFEIWLLFHVSPLDAYSSEEIEEIRSNRKENDRTFLERELVRRMGSYSKANPDIHYFCQHVRAAIKNARQADISPNDRWPNQPGTRVYLLAEQILQETRAD